jgi:alpha-amylase
MVLLVSIAMKRIAIATGLVLMVWTSACGGASNPTAPSNPSPPAPTPPSTQIVFDTSAVAKADPGSALPADWMRKGMIEIYVRGYQDSNGDGIGDLRGLISRLDYIQSLGVGGIWLMPVNQSQDRDHGYAVTDYRSIEADYGTLADFDELIKQAHARGLGVIMDYVVNHSAAMHPAFANSADASSAYRNWYLWQSPKPTGWSIYGSDPWRPSGSQAYFAPFSDSMPDFNLRSETVIDWHLDNMRFWLNRGVDGFRLDAVGHLVENGPNAWDNQPENNTILARLQALTNSYANRYLVCEGPGAPRMYAAKESCGSAFAFQQNGDLMAAANGDGLALQRVASYPTPGTGKEPLRMATLLSNHDAFAGQRVWDQVGGNEGRYKAAASMLLLQPGIPFIYYGEEIGLAGAASLTGDWKLRTPMSWTSEPTHAGFSTRAPFRALSANAATNNVATQTASAGSILAHYKALLKLRADRPSLLSGEYDQATTSGAVLSFRRFTAAQSTWVVVNTSAQAQPVTIRGLAANASWPSVYSSVTQSQALQTDAQGDANFVIPPFATWVFGR